MRCPVLMPHHLDYCESATSTKNLIDILKQKPVDMITFLQSACDDHTWLEENKLAVEEMQQWINRRFYEDKIAPEYIQKLVKAIHSNYSKIYPLLYFPFALYYNITFLVDDAPFLVNGLLFGASSERFKSIIKRTWNTQTNEVKLEKMSKELFPFIIEFINSGTISSLWKSEYLEILDLMYLASYWNLSGLITLCAVNLKRYINKNNAIQTLIQAHKEGFYEWKIEACKFLNRMDLGVEISAPNPKAISFEFLSFKGMSLDVFDQFSDYITHLVVGGTLSDSPTFPDVIHRCPKLIGVDLSGSKKFHEYLSALPKNLKELDLTSCGWLDDRSFQVIVSLCPSLEKLSLVHDIQMSYLGWGELNNLSQLRNVDFSRCHQIDDEILKLIAQSSSNLESVKLLDCKKITDKGMMEALNWWKHLTFLDLSDCIEIEDGTLFEIARHCFELTELRLVNCKGITAKGVTEIVRNLSRLERLDLTSCYLKEGVVDEWRNIRPLANIIF